MAAVLALNRRKWIRQNRIFRGIFRLIEIYSDPELYGRYRFRRLDLLKIVDDIVPELNYT